MPDPKHREYDTWEEHDTLLGPVVRVEHHVVHSLPELLKMVCDEMEREIGAEDLARGKPVLVTTHASR